MCVHVDMYVDMHAMVYVEVRERLAEAESLLPPCMFWGSNTCYSLSRLAASTFTKHRVIFLTTKELLIIIIEILYVSRNVLICINSLGHKIRTNKCDKLFDLKGILNKNKRNALTVT